MSRMGLRQCAAVKSVRELRTSAEQKPASPPPRMRIIATRSANRPSGAAPTSARAAGNGAAEVASKVASAAARRRDLRLKGEDIRGASCAELGQGSIAYPDRL